MVATSKLTVYNDALREIAAAPLADLTTANVSLQTLDGAFDHAVQYVLSRMDWNFARRRAVLTGVSDVTYRPFTRRFARPANYLRKCWIKADPADEFQIDHVESGILIYGFVTSAVMEFISDEPDNYDPSRWPPHFSRVISVYLALLVAPKVARAGQNDIKALWEKLNAALSEAERMEVAFTTNKQIDTVRLPVMRRAIEMLGQQLAGSIDITSQVDNLRWQMDRTWGSCVKFVLEQAPWNFAIRRATLTGTADTAGFPPYTYRYARPSGFLKRSWVRKAATDAFEADYAEAGTAIYGYETSLVLEYISQDANALDPTTWPALFVDTVAAYLAMQVSAVLTVSNDQGGNQQVGASKLREGLSAVFAQYLAQAKSSAALEFTNKAIAPNRLPVMRRAIEIMGQALTGFVVTDESVGKLRWQMDLAWSQVVRFVLEQGAWNFATKRALFTEGEDAETSIASDSIAGIIEGFSVEPGSATPGLPNYAGFDYGFPLPTDFRHKIWLKADAGDDYEIPHQIVRDYIFCNYDACVLEYIAEDDWTTAPEHWPATFLETAAAYLALSVAPQFVVQTGANGAVKITADQIRDKLRAIYLHALSDAKNKDAIQQLPKRIPLGSFARARLGSVGYRH